LASGGGYPSFNQVQFELDTLYFTNGTKIIPTAPFVANTGKRSLTSFKVEIWTLLKQRLRGWRVLLPRLWTCMRLPLLHQGYYIIAILPAWRRGKLITVEDFADVFGLHEALDNHTILGWNNFLFGQWSLKWQVQAKYFASISSWKTSKRWATAILHQFYMNAWDMWQYRGTIDYMERLVP